MIDSKQFETRIVAVEIGKCRYDKRKENMVLLRKPMLIVS